jgi:hypothetical protein
MTTNRTTKADPAWCHNSGLTRICLAAVILCVASVLPALGLTFPATLTNELTGNEIGDDTRNLVICIHGWNNGPVATNRYVQLAEWSHLVSQITPVLQAANSDPWALLLYHWEDDAATGGIDWLDPATAFLHGTEAALNASTHGINLGPRLPSSLRRVHFITHSAGAWCAYRAAYSLMQLNPYVIVQITLLDPYIPNEVPGYQGDYPDYSDASINSMTNWSNASRFYLLENYFADDFPAGIIAGPTLGTQETFSWRPQDINLQVEWSFTYYPYRSGTDLHYDWHSGPTRFYGDTIEAANGGTVQPDLPPSGLPYDYNLNGWKQSLFYKSQGQISALPKITTQPISTNVVSGESVTLRVSATSVRPFTFQWFKRGQAAPISGATFGYYTFTASAVTEGQYVVRIRDSDGNMIFSDFANVTIPGSVTSIGSGAFANCYSLTNVTIPSGVTSIESLVFTGCSSLTSVRIPNSVTNIGWAAFHRCSTLTGIYFQGNAPSVASYAFDGDCVAIVYYLPGTTGWDKWVSPPSAVLWNPQVQTRSASFGVQTNRFGFTITGTTNIPLVVEACTNLTSSVWMPLQSCNLTNGSLYFSDPQWTNHPACFYRLRWP